MNIPPVPLWIKFKAKFFGCGILLISKNEEEYEYTTIRRKYKKLAWGNENQIYIDEKGLHYGNEYYIIHAILPDYVQSSGGKD